eukprot:11028991-Lingulodinium_polyedra.AAC.1
MQKNSRARRPGNTVQGSRLQGSMHFTRLLAPNPGQQSCMHAHPDKARRRSVVQPVLDRDHAG